MKKWVWLTVPALVVALGLVFLGGSVFAQEPGNNAAPGANWTAMYDYCRNIMTGNVTGNDFAGMRSYCQNATAAGDVGPGGPTGGCGGFGRGGMMGGYTGNGTYGPGGMMGNRSFGRGMMGW